MQPKITKGFIPDISLEISGPRGGITAAFKEWLKKEGVITSPQRW